MTIYPGFSTRSDGCEIWSARVARGRDGRRRGRGRRSARPRPATSRRRRRRRSPWRRATPCLTSVLAEGWRAGTPVLPLLDVLRSRLDPDSAPSTSTTAHHPGRRRHRDDVLMAAMPPRAAAISAEACWTALRVGDRPLRHRWPPRPGRSCKPAERPRSPFASLAGPHRSTTARPRAGHLPGAARRTHR